VRNSFVVIALVAAAIATSVLAGDKPPEKTQGLSVNVLHQNNLGAQIGAMQKYDIRSRYITFAPGAAIAEHSHAERPGMVYVIKGGIIEYRNGERNEYKAGDSWIETADTVHWAKNASDDEESIIFMVDLPPSE